MIQKSGFGHFFIMFLKNIPLQSMKRDEVLREMGY